MKEEPITVILQPEYADCGVKDSIDGRLKVVNVEIVRVDG